MKLYNIIKPLIKKYKQKLLLFTITNVIIAIVSTTLPIISGRYIDELIQAPNMAVIYKFCLLLFFMSVFSILASYFVSMMSVVIKSKMSYDLNKKVVFHIQELPFIETKGMNYTYVNQRINSDSNILISFTISFFETCIVNVISFIIIFVYIFYINKVLAFCLLLLDLVYLFCFLCLKNKLLKTKEIVKDRGAKYYVALLEQLDKIKFLKISGKKDSFRLYLDKNFNELLEIVIKNQRLSFLFQSSETIIFMISQILLFIIGGINIINGNLTIGTFSILSGYFSKLITSTKSLISLGNNYIDAKTAMILMSEFLERKPEQKGILKVDDIDKINIDTLNFGYGIPLITDLSISFKKGKIYCISGANGAGKTTLLDIIMGCFNNSIEDSIFFNDISLKKFDLEYLYKNKVSYCLQHPIIIKGNLQDNVLVDNRDVEPEKLNILIKEFGFDDSYFTENMNDLSKELQEGNLSGGEQQKISIIRTLIKDCDVMLFDEPTSSLDFNSKLFFIEEIKRISTSKIIIIVTHDQNLINICDLNLEL